MSLMASIRMEEELRELRARVKSAEWINHKLWDQLTAVSSVIPMISTDLEDINGMLEEHIAWNNTLYEDYNMLFEEKIELHQERRELQVALEEAYQALDCVCKHRDQLLEKLHFSAEQYGSLKLRLAYEGREEGE